MAGSEFELDLSELETLSARMQMVAALNMDRLLNSLGVTEETEVKERFESKTDPEGGSWESWSAAYRTRRRQEAPGASLLMGPDARLQESIVFEVTGDGILWGSALVYARVHQKGYDEKNIPARPYLGIGKESGRLLMETVEDFIHRETGGLF